MAILLDGWILPILAELHRKWFATDGAPRLVLQPNNYMFLHAESCKENPKPNSEVETLQMK